MDAPDDREVGSSQEKRSKPQAGPERKITALYMERLEHCGRAENHHQQDNPQKIIDRIRNDLRPVDDGEQQGNHDVPVPAPVPRLGITLRQQHQDLGGNPEQAERKSGISEHRECAICAGSDGCAAPGKGVSY